MKNFLLFVSFLFLISNQIFAQNNYRLNAKADGTIGEFHTMVDDGTNGDVTPSDGIYSFKLTITDAQSFGQWLININGSNTPNSWYVTTSSVQDVLFTINTNTMSDGWLPTTNIINADDQLSSGHSIKIIIDGAAAQTMVDDGTNGDVTAGDGIYAFHSVVASTGTHTWNAENSSRGNFHWTANNNGRINSWTDATSFNTTADNQDVYFYLNVTTGRVLTKLDSPLPVELTTFTANVVDGNVVLNWETATEVNNFGFNIEKKHGSKDWQKIGFVEGVGNSNSPKDYFFNDKTFDETGKYYYRLKQIDFDGRFEYSNIVEVTINSTTQFELTQNYPNPFNPTTVIKFSVPQNGLTTLKVFNIRGQEIATLLNKNLAVGEYHYKFDASSLTSGIYLYQLKTDNYSAVKKMILIK